jgi:DNA polymerase-3 subunit epsilon
MATSQSIQIPCLKNRTYAIIDTETTGTNPAYNQIIEIGIIRVEDGRITKKLKTFIRPASRLPSFITSITGISQEDLIDAPVFEEVALEIRDILEGAIFVAHNARFDYSFVKNEFKRIGISWNVKTLCTVRLSRALFPHYPRHNLDEIIERFGIVCKERHRAYDDALVLYEFFKKLDAAVEGETLAAAIDTILGNHTLPPEADPKLVRALPHKPGVYLFYDEEGTVIYVGKSIDIKSRILSHFSSDHTSTKELRMCEKIVRIECRETSGELSALFLESRLIKELSPFYNRALRKTRSLAIITRQDTKEGYYTIELGYHDEIPEAADSVLAVFRTVRQAKEFMQTVAREHTLCPKILGIENVRDECFQRQLGRCNSACIGIESPEIYNQRFDAAFADRRIKSWPFGGPIIVKEDPEADEGVAYVIDSWRIIRAIRYNQDGIGASETTDALFDFDTYKILLHHLLKKSVRESVIPYRSDVRGSVLDEEFATIT